MTDYQMKIFESREKKLFSKMKRHEFDELARAMEAWAGGKHKKAINHVGKINHDLALEVLFYLTDFQEYCNECEKRGYKNPLLEPIENSETEA